MSTVLKEIWDRLAGGSETASLDAQVLLAHVLDKPRAWVMAHSEASLSTGQRRLLESCLQRLEAGEPLPYVLGHWEFYGLDFKVTRAVLIPRPETELLVEGALAWLQAHPKSSSRYWSAVDVGTGSGCIAISLAANLPGLHVLAADVSLPALRLAAENARKNSVAARVGFLQSDLFPPAASQFDLVCANLPYIPTAALQALPVSRWEPRLALDGGPDGLTSFRRFFAAVPRRLAPVAQMLLEIEETLGPEVMALARRALPQAEVRMLHDLAGRERVVEVNLS